MSHYRLLWQEAIEPSLYLIRTTIISDHNDDDTIPHYHEDIDADDEHDDHDDHDVIEAINNWQNHIANNPVQNQDQHNNNDDDLDDQDFIVGDPHFFADTGPINFEQDLVTNNNGWDFGW